MTLSHFGLWLIHFKLLLVFVFLSGLQDETLTMDKPGDRLPTSFDVGDLHRALLAAQKSASCYVLKEFHRMLGRMLIEAIKAGDVKCAKHLIDAGANPESAQYSFQDDTDIAFSVFAAKWYSQFGFPVPDETAALGAYIKTSTLLDCDICRKNSEESFGDISSLVYNHEYRFVGSCLFHAIKNNDAAAAKLLTENGASLFEDYGYWKECYHVNPVEIAILEEADKVLTLFILQGTNINERVSRAVLEKCKSNCFEILLKGRLHWNRFNSKEPLAVAAGFSGPGIPLTLKEPKPFSLKYIARGAIRMRLLEVNKENLFCLATPQRLLFPKLLCRYIVCDFEL